MRKVKASTRQNSNLVPISALACLPLNPVSLYSPASAHETRRKALVSRRNSIFSYYLEEPKQLLWPGRRQVQNGNLTYMKFGAETGNLSLLLACVIYCFCSSKPQNCGLVRGSCYSLSFLTPCPPKIGENCSCSEYPGHTVPQQQRE